MTDPFEAFKASQREGWAHFAPLEMVTTPPAARLVKHAAVCAGQRVLDVGCGTGVVAVTAARMGARVTGLDLTPALLEHARNNARTAAVEIEWHEGDVERMPFGDGAFDVVLSQYGHMFAPRPDVAVAEMLRVLRPDGTLAFSTWPPDQFIGRMFALVGRYAPPPPPGVSPPPLWGDPDTVRKRLGAKVRDLAFDRATTLCPALSPQHYRSMMERTGGPMIKLVASLQQSDPEKLAELRREFEALVSEYFADNVVRQEYLLTRATRI